MLKRVRPELPVGCVSDLRFDALQAGELSANAARDIEAHTRGCARCQARQRALAADNDAVRARLPPFVASAGPTPAPGVEHRKEPRSAAQRARPALWIGALAAAAALCFALIPRQDAGHTTRAKGGPNVSFYIKRGNDVHAWLPNEVVAPRDLLRFVVAPWGFQYLAIFSRGASGHTATYFPAGDQAAAVDPQVPRYPLPGAVELDDTVEDEQIHAVFCPAPFALAPLLAELSRTGAVTPGPGCRVTTLTLRKRATP